MSRFVSVNGKFYPARERVVLKNETNSVKINPSADYSKYAGEEIPPGADFIYEGPDRQALYELYKAGNLEYLGQDFRKSPDFLELIRKLDFKKPNEYFKFMGIDVEELEKKQKEKIAQVTGHELPEKVEAIKILGGGKDTAGGGNDVYGGFGNPPKVG